MWGRAVRTLGCGSQDLIFNGDFLEVEFQALVLGDGSAMGLFEGCDLGFEFFDMTLFAFSKGTLPMCICELNDVILECRALRCTVLSFPPSLRRRHVLIVAVAALTVLIAIRVPIGLKTIVGDWRYGLVKGLRGRRLGNTTAIEMIVGVEYLEVIWILSKH